MVENLPQSGFSEVDRDADPPSLIHQLDFRTGAPFHLAYKRRAIELLDLKVGDKVLDVGSGTGDDVRLLAQLVGPEGHAVGMDASETMIAEAITRHGASSIPVTFLVGDAADLPFADGRFDGCLAVRTFQHLADPRRALAEMVRVTRSGGRLAVVDPDHDTAVIGGPDRGLARQFLNFRADTIRNGGIAHQMLSLFKEHQLRDVSVIPMTEVRTEYAEVEESMHYEGGIRVAAELGVLSPEDAERMTQELRSAADSGRFLSAMTYFLTIGRKP